MEKSKIMSHHHQITLSLGKRTHFKTLYGQGRAALGRHISNVHSILTKRIHVHSKDFFSRLVSVLGMLYHNFYFSFFVLSPTSPPSVSRLSRRMWEPRRLTTLWAFTACYRDRCLPIDKAWSQVFILLLLFLP
jgi:hypothetical protein